MSVEKVLGELRGRYTAKSKVAYSLPWRNSYEAPLVNEVDENGTKVIDVSSRNLTQIHCNFIFDEPFAAFVSAAFGKL